MDNTTNTRATGSAAAGTPDTTNNTPDTGDCTADTGDCTNAGTADAQRTADAQPTATRNAAPNTVPDGPDISPEDAEFLRDIMTVRMEFCWRQRRGHTPETTREEARRYLEESRPFNELLERLPDEDCLIISRYLDLSSERHTGECDFYYKAGFLDGLRVANAVRSVK